MSGLGAYSVETQLRVRTRVVEADERWALEQKIAGREPKRFAGLDPATASWLVRIEAKLDCMLAAMGMPQDGAPLSGAAREVCLSESGIVLRDESEHAVGDHVWLEMEIPGTPPAAVVSLARVVDAGGGDTRLDFEVMHELDRKAIVDHSLEVQRRKLRMRSGLAGEPV